MNIVFIPIRSALVKNQSYGHAKKVNVVQLPSTSARTKADRKRSD